MSTTLDFSHTLVSVCVYVRQKVQLGWRKKKTFFHPKLCISNIFHLSLTVCRLNYNIQEYINTQLNDSAVARTGCCIDQSCDPQGSL